MSYAAKVFSSIPNASVVAIELPSPFDEMVIKDIDITVVKCGSNDVVGQGHCDISNQIASFSVSNSSDRKSNYVTDKCIYVQEYVGNSWVNKLVGTADISTAGEIWFHFDNYDANYHILGIAHGELS